MTLGPSTVLEVIAGITSPDARERRVWADRTGFDFADHGGVDDDERRALAPGHVWCMCIEPSAETREYFLSTIGYLAAYDAVSPTMVAEVLEWLAVTGTDPRAEADYVASFREIVEASGAVPEVALTPERAAPFVDLLRGITSASTPERARAAHVVPDLLAALRREEQWGVTGVLARAAIVEDDADVRGAQLDALGATHHAGAVHEHDGRLLGDAFVGVSLAVTERRIVDVLDDRRR